MSNTGKNLIAIIFLAVLGWIAFNMSKDRPQTPEDLESPVAESTTQEASDLREERACLTGEVEQEATTEFFTGKVFVNYEQSGEQGMFLENGELRTDWVSDDGYEVKGNLAMWAVLDGDLSVADASLSDWVYEDFKFYEYNGDVYAVPNGGAWFFVGPSYDKIESFFNAKYMKEACR